MTDYEFCILTENNDLIEYEKKLYAAFSKRSPHGWIAQTYSVIDQCRYKHKNLDYKDLVIYSAKHKNEIIAGSAVNLTNKKFEFESKGFSIKEGDNNKKIADGLSMFIDEKCQGQNSMNLGFSLFDFIIKDLHLKGYNTIYGTCYKKLKATYLLLDWELIDTKKINEEDMFLFKYNIN